jgi:predicted AAA+ superfamily ATPase
MTDRLFFKMNKCTIITDDVETIENYGDKSIRFVALWKWLLD